MDNIITEHLVRMNYIDTSHGPNTHCGWRGKGT